MKTLINLLLIITITLFSFTSNAYELSELKLKLIRDPNGHWTPFFVDSNNFNTFLSEFSLYEKQADGSIVVPVYVADKNAKQITNVEWFRFGCDDENFLDLGDFRDGLFTRNKFLDENHSFRYIRYFFCPSDGVDGKKYLVTKAHLEVQNKRYIWWGWSPEDTVMAEVGDQKILKGTMYQMTVKDKKIVPLSPFKFELNCKEKNIFSIRENKNILYSSPENKSWRFFIDTACLNNGLFTELVKTPKR